MARSGLPSKSPTGTGSSSVLSRVFRPHDTTSTSSTPAVPRAKTCPSGPVVRVGRFNPKLGEQSDRVQYPEVVRV